MQPVQNNGSRVKIYRGGAISKTPIRANSNRDIHGKNLKEGETASPTNPEKGRAGNCKINNEGHPSNLWTRGKTCLLHGPGHSMDECKVLKEYTAKYAAQRSHNEIEARSGGNKKRGKTVKFNGATEEVNRMTDHGASIPRKKKQKNQ